MNEETWPEQNVINAWFERYSLELKKEVSVYRIETQKKLDKQYRITNELMKALKYYQDLDNGLNPLSLPKGCVVPRAHEVLAKLEKEK